MNAHALLRKVENSPLTLLVVVTLAVVVMGGFVMEYTSVETGMRYGVAIAALYAFAAVMGSIPAE